MVGRGQTQIAVSEVGDARLDPVVLARVLRSGWPEATHRGHVAVADDTGTVLAHAGDPHSTVLARSCLKPLQAAVCMALADEGDLSAQEIAIMCASHSGEQSQVAAVARLLSRARTDARALQCPPVRRNGSSSIDEREGRRELHGCSGKHAGMLLACMRRDWDPKTYMEPQHPLQVVIRDALEETIEDRIVAAIDGCGVPTYGMSLASLATLYARFARTSHLPVASPEIEQCVAAMTSEPYLVGDDTAPDSVVMTSRAGIVAKVGAEGLLCAGLLDEGIGVAIKIEDGALRPTATVLTNALTRLGIDSSMISTSTHRDSLASERGSPGAEIVSDFELVPGSPDR